MIAIASTFTRDWDDKELMICQELKDVPGIRAVQQSVAVFRDEGVKD